MKKATLTLLSIFCIMNGLPAHGLEKYCDDQTEILIVSDTTENHDFICSAALEAIVFLSRLQLNPRRKITIEISEQPIHVHGMPVYGLYDGETDRVQLMSFRSIEEGLKNPMIFGENFDREHYFGAVAHEVTHALLYQQKEMHPISASLQEYFAYSVQLAVLSPQRRAAIFQRMAIDAWMPGDTLTVEYMAIQPGFFAVKSYKHLMALSEPSAFVRKLLLSKQMYVYLPGKQLRYQ